MLAGPCFESETILTATEMNPRLFTFVDGDSGSWRVASARSITGDGIADVAWLKIVHGVAPSPAGARWRLRGMTSDVRYVK